MDTRRLLRLFAAVQLAVGGASLMRSDSCSEWESMEFCEGGSTTCRACIIGGQYTIECNNWNQTCEWCMWSGPYCS